MANEFQIYSKPMWDYHINKYKKFFNAQKNIPQRNLNCLKQSVIATHDARFKVVLEACQRHDSEDVPHDVKALFKIWFTDIGQSNGMN